MSISSETIERVNKFVKEQAQYHIDAAEMTYLEMLRMEAGLTKQKIGKELSRFKISSDQAKEAQSDMSLYMSHYINDLMSKGMSEQQAFAKAKEELSISGKPDFSADLQKRLEQYYKDFDPSEYEAVGLFYGGFAILGIVIGALSGYIISGGWQEFLLGGWIDILVGAAAGAVFGSGLGAICNAIVSVKKAGQ